MGISFQATQHASKCPEGPSADFHLGGAHAVLSLLNIPAGDGWGTIPADQLGTVRQCIFRLLNKPQDRQVVVHDGYSTKVVNGPTIHVGAITDESIQRRLRELDAVLAHAQKIGGYVVWG